MITQPVSAKGVARLIVCLVIILALLGPLTSPLQAAAHVNAGFVVNSTGDSVSGGGADGSCDVGGGVCTLREAIKEANAAGSSKNITFSLTNATINLTLGALIIAGNYITIGAAVSATLPSAVPAIRQIRTSSISRATTTWSST
jgi:CSLREA domain-containing protein